MFPVELTPSDLELDSTPPTDLRGRYKANTTRSRPGEPRPAVLNAFARRTNPGSLQLSPGVVVHPLSASPTACPAPSAGEGALLASRRSWQRFAAPSRSGARAGAASEHTSQAGEAGPLEGSALSARRVIAAWPSASAIAAFFLSTLLPAVEDNEASAANKEKEDSLAVDNCSAVPGALCSSPGNGDNEGARWVEAPRRGQRGLSPPASGRESALSSDTRGDSAALLESIRLLGVAGAAHGEVGCLGSPACEKGCVKVGVEPP